MTDIIPDIRMIYNKMEKQSCAEIMAESEPWITLGITYKQIMDTLNDELNEVFAVYVENEIIGTIVIQTKGAFSGYLKSIALKESWRGNNLGKKMMGIGRWPRAPLDRLGAIGNRRWAMGNGRWAMGKQ